MSTITHLTGVEDGRARIDAIDEELIALVRRRLDVSLAIQSTRLSAGGPRVATARETQVVGRYRAALGRPGGTIALALLELARGIPTGS